MTGGSEQECPLQPAPVPLERSGGGFGTSGQAGAQNGAEDRDREPCVYCDSPPAIGPQHLRRQAAWSRATFGPGDRERGVTDHIRKELVEVAEANSSADKLAEWVDVVILALDGAWRCGASPEEIIAAIKAKQARNERRSWPDWRTAPADQAIEHVAEPHDAGVSS